jgi:hypothetical protein
VWVYRGFAAWREIAAGEGNKERQRFAVAARQTARGGFDKLRVTI